MLLICDVILLLYFNLKDTLVIQLNGILKIISWTITDNNNNNISKLYIHVIKLCLLISIDFVYQRVVSELNFVLHISFINSGWFNCKQ